MSMNQKIQEVYDALPVTGRYLLRTSLEGTGYKVKQAGARVYIHLPPQIYDKCVKIMAGLKPVGEHRKSPRMAPRA